MTRRFFLSSATALPVRRAQDDPLPGDTLNLASPEFGRWQYRVLRRWHDHVEYVAAPAKSMRAPDTAVTRIVHVDVWRRMVWDAA